MSSTARKQRLHVVSDAWPAGLVVGWLVDLAADGQARVDFDGNRRGPLPARSTVRVRGEALVVDRGRVELLLAFPDGEDGPMIVGIVDRALVEAPADATTPSKDLHARVDGNDVRIAAAERIELCCGQGSITLTADGRVVIKGRELVSRAAESNKIRGASVLIN